MHLGLSGENVGFYQRYCIFIVTILHRYRISEISGFIKFELFLAFGDLHSSSNTDGIVQLV